jgi:hypothetical protein
MPPIFNRHIIYEPPVAIFVIHVLIGPATFFKYIVLLSVNRAQSGELDHVGNDHRSALYHVSASSGTADWISRGHYLGYDRENSSRYLSG